MDDEIKKRVDESWKEAKDKERETLKGGGESIPPAVADFNFFITTLALQASIALGQIPNPATNQKEENIEQAKFLIDTLAMLEEKTKGNLQPQEADLLENLLYELHMQYLDKTSKGKNNIPGGNK